MNLDILGVGKRESWLLIVFCWSNVGGEERMDGDGDAEGLEKDG